LPTVTDANLVLGRLPADGFLGGQMALDTAAAEATLTMLAQAAGLVPRAGLTPAQTAALGVVEVVNAHMERALRVISVQRGYDPQDFTLVSFGGAGGLHAGELARSLKIPRVLISPMAATLSAFGMLTADVIKDYVQTIMLPGDTPYGELATRMAPLLAQAVAEIEAEGVTADRISLEPMLDMRYQGQSYELIVPFDGDFLTAFHQAHTRVYGYRQPDRAVELVNLRLRAIGRLPQPVLKPSLPGDPDPTAALSEYQPIVLADGIIEAPFYQGALLQPGHQIEGPAIIVHPDTTLLVGRSDRLQVDEYHNIILSITPSN
jgi:N-methylhydantoinase A